MELHILSFLAAVDAVKLPNGLQLMTSLVERRFFQSIL
jgi:hypothetical protein